MSRNYAPLDDVADDLDWCEWCEEPFCPICGNCKCGYDTCRHTRQDIKHAMDSGRG